MQTSVNFKNLEPSEALKSYVTEKLNRFDKLLDNPAEAYVVLSIEKFRHIADVRITGDRLNINGREETNDMYSAIDMVLDKLEKQIKKSKQKIKGHRGAKTKVGDMIVEKAVSPESEITPEVRIQAIEFKPMDVEEAVMQMDLVEDNFIVFTNSKTSQVNVLYRRKDGHYGLIQPQ